MAGGGDKDIGAARAYSAAMLQLAEATGEADLLLRELSGLVSQINGDPELEAFFSSPMIDAAAREESIERIFRGNNSDLLVDSLQILNRKNRLSMLRAVTETYRLALEAVRGEVDVEVRSAVALTDALRERIKELARKRTGKEGRLIEEIDELLVGGVVIQIEDQKLDASVASRLGRFHESLLERASREIHEGSLFIESAAENA